MVRCEREAEVTEVRADDVLNLRQMGCGVQPHHGAASVEVFEHVSDGGGIGLAFEPDVDAWREFRAGSAADAE